MLCLYLFHVFTATLNATDFSVLISNYLLVVFRNTIDFYILISCLVILLTLVLEAFVVLMLRSFLQSYNIVCEWRAVLSPLLVGGLLFLFLALLYQFVPTEK